MLLLCTFFSWWLVISSFATVLLGLLFYTVCYYCLLLLVSLVLIILYCDTNMYGCFFFLLLIDRSVLRCTKAKDIFKLCVICKDGSLFIFSFGVGDILRETVLVKRVDFQRLLLLILVVVS